MIYQLVNKKKSYSIGILYTIKRKNCIFDINKSNYRVKEHYTNIYS